MTLPQRDRSRFNSKFRLKRKPTVSFLGFIGEPPTQVRGETTPALVLETGVRSAKILGKLIESTVGKKTLYLVGNFLDYSERNTYRIYEVTSYVMLQRDIVGVHPVTKQKVNKGIYTQMVWVCEEPIQNKIEYSENPVQKFNLRLDIPVKERDIIGNYLVRNVYKENDLWVAQCEYNVVGLDTTLSLQESQDGEILQLQTGESIEFMGKI